MNHCCLRYPVTGVHVGAAILVWLLLLLAPSLAVAESKPTKTLRIAYMEFPPITYRNEAGEPSGSMIDITRMVVEEAGYTPEFIYLPVSRVYLYLSNGQIDVWPGLTNIPSLDGEVLESWVSPMSIQLSAWYHDKKTAPLTHFSQLDGKTVIVIGGYTYAGLIDWFSQSETIRITEAPNHRSAVDMLKRNRGDYLLDYRQPVQEILTQPSDQGIVESEVRTRNASWLFSLASPRAAILREEFDDAYLRLVEAGKMPPVRTLSPGFVIPGFPQQYR